MSSKHHSLKFNGHNFAIQIEIPIFALERM